MDTFKKNLRDQLNFACISVKTLSDKTGISKRTIENYLSKRESLPPADYACKIANVLDCSVEWLINGKDPEIEAAGDDDAAKNLLRDYKTLPPDKQRFFCEMIHDASEKARKERKNNSNNDYQFPTSRSNN